MEIKTSDQTCLLKHENIEINCSDLKVNDKSWFKFSYWTCKIHTHPFGWTVIRKDTEFYELREHLCKKFPQYVIPYLPQMQVYKTEPRLIKQKEKYFEKFLNAVLLNEELRGSKFLEEFLSIEDDAGFKQVKKLHQ